VDGFDSAMFELLLGGLLIVGAGLRWVGSINQRATVGIPSAR